MSNYNNLRNGITSVVKTNGNNEITGQLLQNELLAMVTTLGYGYQYMGVANPATNPGTPDAKVFYIAYQPGTYSNFGGTVVSGLCTLKYDTSWRKEDIPVSGGGGTTFTPNAEDLELVNSVLQFANRINPNNTNGLGYKILRPASSFASQVTDEDTIYEIRYNYDLNGSTVSIPNNCTLKFVGGSISNGTLGGNFKIDAGLEKIFTNIVFVNGAENNEIELDWFVSNRSNTCVLDGTQPDATTQIQDAFNSKSTRIHISNRYYYYISDTIIVNSWQAIIGEKQASALQRSTAQAPPSIYTDTDKIMMIVYANNDDGNKYSRNLVIDNLYLRRYAEFTSSNFKDDIPILKLTNSAKTETMTYNNVWGCKINVFLFSADRQLTIVVNGQSHTTWLKGFLGIEIDVTNGGYFTLIDISGDITGFRRAIYTHVTNGWMTDTRINFDSTCAFGGELNGAPYRINGSHQSQAEIIDDTETAYFILNGGNGVSNAKIWDLRATDSTTGLKSARFAYKARQGFIDDLNYIQSVNTDSFPITPNGEHLLPFNAPNEYTFKTEMFRIIGFERNLLELRFCKICGHKLTDEELYTIYQASFDALGKFNKIVLKDSQDNEIALGADNVLNYSHLFKVAGSINNTLGQLNDIYIDDCVLSNDIATTYNKYVVEFQISYSIASNIFNWGAYFGLLKFGSAASVNNIVKFEYINSSNAVVYTRTYTGTDSFIYYSKMIFSEIQLYGGTYSTLRITFEIPIASSGTNRTLPKLFIVTPYIKQTLTPSGGEIPYKTVFGQLYGWNYTTNPMRGFRCWNDPHINKSFSASTNATLYTAAICIGTNGKADFYLTLIDEKGRQSVLYVSNTDGKSYTDSPNFKFRIKKSSTAGNTDNKFLIGVQTTDSSVAKYTIDYIQCSGKFKFYDSLSDTGLDVTEYVYPKRGLTANRPTNAIEGDTYYDSSLKKMILHNGTDWVNMDGSALS